MNNDYDDRSPAPDENPDTFPSADAGRYTQDRTPPRSADVFSPYDWQKADESFPQQGGQHPPPGGQYPPQNTQYPPQQGYGYGYSYGYPTYGGVPPQRRRSKLKIPLIIISVLVLIVATALLFMGPDYLDVNPILRFPDFEDSENPPQRTRTPNRRPEETLPAATPDLPQGELGTGVVMKLSSKSEGEIMTYQDIYKQCSPWVVAIEAEVDSWSYNWGTGIVFTGDGYIVTNNHIIAGTTSVRITLHDDTVYEALLIGVDARSDLAVLKIDAEDLPCAVFGDSSELEVGEGVVAIGNPLGREFRSTLTDGIISAIDRDVQSEGYSMTLLQTNAAINEGNSGGPLFNLYGQVIGITNMKMISYYQGIEGIGFAIPSKQMKIVVDQLIENGYAAGVPMLGITGGVPPEDSDAENTPEGVYVNNVDKRSGAYQSGIRAGDIITAVNGEPVTSVGDINDAKEPYGIGDSITISIYREGKTYNLDVVLMDSNKLE